MRAIYVQYQLISVLVSKIPVYWLSTLKVCPTSTGHRMVVGFTTTYEINPYHHSSWELEHRSWRGELDTILCDKVGQ